MAELYVDAVIHAVSSAVPLHDECRFWEWLGNHKYKEDGGELSPERAAEIQAMPRALYAEFRDWWYETTEEG